MRPSASPNLLPAFTRARRLAWLAALLAASPLAAQTPAAPSGKELLVFQTDFGLKDGAVAEMKGVATSVDANLKLYDLTHEIPAFNTWEASFRLWQTVLYWPAGTVFVSVVDPGVGTKRKSVVARTITGQYIVTPDNGTLTLLAEKVGLDAVREIDETKNRRAGSEASYTFHGRDVYSYTGARLAAGVINYEEVGPALDPAGIVKIEYPHAAVIDGGKKLAGNIPVLDPQYGNVWTNIDAADFARLQPKPKPGDLLRVQIVEWDGPDTGTASFDGTIPYANSFGDVPMGKPLLYLNSLMDVSFALNEGNFAAEHHVKSGPKWKVLVGWPDATWLDLPH